MFEDTRADVTDRSLPVCRRKEVYVVESIKFQKSLIILWSTVQVCDALPFLQTGLVVRFQTLARLQNLITVLQKQKAAAFTGRMMNFKEAFQQKLNASDHKYLVSGVVAQDGTVFPLGSDTKVLSTIFELFTRPLMIELAIQNNLILIEPTVQNHYPDFTLCSSLDSRQKIAVDVKTTYIEKPNDRFGFTLGGYTSFIREGNERKNIVFPFGEYTQHWVVGYVYERAAFKSATAHAVYSVDQIKDIPLPYKNVRVFVQEKWRISSDRAGSGNTTNIGSIFSDLPGFINGNGPFQNEEEFLDYWRNYGRTAADRDAFKNIAEYRNWRQSNQL